MIEFTKAYKISTGSTFPTITEAQRAELIQILNPGSPNGMAMIETILEHAGEIADLLTTTPASKPRARKVNGGKKTRKPTATEINAEIQPGQKMLVRNPPGAQQ